jgi:hypothetical protein
MYVMHECNVPLYDNDKLLQYNAPAAVNTNQSFVFHTLKNIVFNACFLHHDRYVHTC